MYRIKTLNKISSIGLDFLDRSRFQVGDEVKNEDGILLRSANMHSYEFPPALRAVARAGAGTNNIPIERCSENGIVVFNTPGGNANAVKELVVCSLLLASRDIVGGIDWVQEQIHTPGVELATAVEKGKSAFTGPELMGKTLGLIGLGAIGVRVANICYRMGMEVIGYDPFLSVNTALSLDRHIHVAGTLDEIYRQADYITLHVPVTSSTREMINKDSMGKMKGGVRILNLARGELVNDEDMEAALESGRVAKYVTDFPNERLAVMKQVIAMPHLGASTPESEDNCALMAAGQLQEYLVNGNIHNSVNLPDVEMSRSGICRICLIHKNVPSVLSHITSTLSDATINVENLTNKSKKDFAYTLLDVDTRITDEVANRLRDIPGMIRVRILHH